MSPEDVYEARVSIGLARGQNQISCVELGRMLRMDAKDLGVTVRRWENGTVTVPGPASVAIEALVSGFKPATIKRDTKRSI